MSNASSRRFVLVSAPSVHAGIGDALRRAFECPDRWSARMFEKLIRKLDRY